MSERTGPFSRLKNKAKEFKNYLTERDTAIPGADPFVRVFGDSFLYITTTNNRRISIRNVPDLRHLGDRSHETTVLERSAGIWAPELHFIGDRWVVPVSISRGYSENAEMYVFASQDDNPLGRYEPEGRLSPGRWAIDMTYLQYDGGLYAIFSSRDGDDKPFPQNLYIAPMSDPFRLSGEAVCISTPEHSWEKRGAAVNEGPQVRINNGNIELIFSASGSWTGDYRMGRLRLNGDPMNPLAWVKDPVPFYRPNFGHGCFVVLPDGSEWVVAGEKLVPDEPGWDRVVRSEPFDETLSGVAIFEDRPVSVDLEGSNPMAA